jgi:excisionase family DNA binding protein
MMPETVANENSQLLGRIVEEATKVRDAAEAAKELRCHRSTIYREVSRGRLNHYRVGNRIRFTQEHLDEYRSFTSGNRLACSSQREREVLRLCQC